jgi:hypothetical protein
MEKSGISLTPQQKEIFKELPAFETITRIRRTLQEQGKYEPDHHVLEARYNKYKTVRESINHEDLEKILESNGYTILPFGE